MCSNGKVYFGLLLAGGYSYRLDKDGRVGRRWGGGGGKGREGDWGRGGGGGGNVNLFIKEFKLRLVDYFKQDWHAALDSSDFYNVYFNFNQSNVYSNFSQ